MINKSVLERFWKDYYIQTQEEHSDFPYANVSDAGRALIKGRNWTGTFTEMLLTISESISINKKELTVCEHDLNLVERDVLAFAGTTSYVSKNKDLMKAHIWANAVQAQKDLITVNEKRIITLKGVLEELGSEKEILELILKKLDKTTDWLVQYINWQKYELRFMKND